MSARWIGWTSVIALAVALAGCGDSGEEDGGGEDLRMLLSFHEGLAWLPLPVAEDQGYFEEEGLSLKVETANGSGYVTQQLIAGNVDVGWAGAGDAIIAFSKDDDIRALLCQPPGQLFQIVTLADSGIENVGDLEGKALGITEKGGGEEPIVNAALADAGLDRMSDLQVLPIGAAGPQSLEALRSGQVAAYASSYPDIISLEAEGLDLVNITPENLKGIPGDCLITTQQVLEDADKRDKIVKLARAWIMGGTFAQANEAAALEIGCKAYPADCTDAAFAELYVKTFLELTAPAEGLDFGTVPVDDWLTTYDVLESSGVVAGGLDVTPMVEGSVIDEARAEFLDFDHAAVEDAAQSFEGAQ
jgi:NitT/TauT family transport system substrate-binding protein